MSAAAKAKESTTGTTRAPAAEFQPHASPLGRRWYAISAYLYPVIAVVGVVFVWHSVITIFDIPPFTVPPPASVAEALVANAGILIDNLWPTLFSSATGFLLGNVVAIGLAILFVHSRPAEAALFPLAVAVKTVPIIAIAPVLVLMLGYGYAPKIVIAALITFFPALVNMVRGLKSVDKDALELFRVMSATRRQVFMKLRVFNSLPYLFSALKITAPISVIGAIVAEWIGAREGLGYLIINATHNFRTPLLYATMIVSSLLAISFVLVVSIAERLVVKWEPEEHP